MPDTKVFCPLLKREISQDYCWELCNIASDDILLSHDRIEDWDVAAHICDACGYWE